MGVSFAPFTHTLRVVRMVGGTGGNWKRPVNRMYAYNYQVGENYYLPMTSYIESKAEKAANSLPGPLCFSERIAAHPIVGQQKPRYHDNTLSSAPLKILRSSPLAGCNLQTEKQTKSDV